MDFIYIVINRIENKNYFSLMEGNNFNYFLQLESLVDDDLIIEYLNEINKIAEATNTLAQIEKSSSFNLYEELKKIGSLFFTQFFPIELQELLRHYGFAYLFFQVTSSIKHIPWELLYNKDHFLCEKFSISKNTYNSFLKPPPLYKDKIKMLIISNPTGDLDWASLEGEKLYKELTSNEYKINLEVNILAGKSLNKIELLKAIQYCDIIHHVGHTYFDQELQQGGWLLSHNKVVYAREIQKLQIVPFLVFSNSCKSTQNLQPPRAKNEIKKNILETSFSLPYAFMDTGLCSYLGTHWDVVDSQKSSDFTILFYNFLFKGMTIGEALFNTCKKMKLKSSKNDISWANYTLMGDPRVHILKDRKNLKNRLKVFHDTGNDILNHYPLLLVRPYTYLHQQINKESELELSTNFILLIQLFEDTIRLIIVISKSVLKEKYSEVIVQINHHDDSLFAEYRALYEYINGLTHDSNLKLIFEIFSYIERNLHEIDYMFRWTLLYKEGSILKNKLHIHFSNFYYTLEHFLIDLSIFSQFHFIYIGNANAFPLLLNGGYPKRYHNKKALSYIQNYEKQRPNAQICLYYTSHQEESLSLVSMDPFLKYDLVKNEMKISLE